MTALGQTRPVLPILSTPLPLSAVGDQLRVAVQYVVEGQHLTCQMRPLIRFLMQRQTSELNLRRVRAGTSEIAQGKPADIGGYYLPDTEKCQSVMRPSATLNTALAQVGDSLGAAGVRVPYDKAAQGAENCTASPQWVHATLHISLRRSNGAHLHRPWRPTLDPRAPLNTALTSREAWRKHRSGTTA